MNLIYFSKTQIAATQANTIVIMKEYIYRINKWLIRFRSKNTRIDRDLYLVIENKGMLCELINEREARKVTRLTITGPLDGCDMDYIHNSFRRLRELDLSDCIISAGEFRCSVHKDIHQIKACRVVPHMFHIEKLISITLPFSTTDLCLNNMWDPGAFINSLEKINISEKNRFYSSLNGILYDKERKALLKAPPAVKNVIIPLGVRLISKGSFKDCKTLRSVSIPETVTYIGDYAFENCISLKVLRIPQSLVHAGLYPFGKNIMFSDIYCFAEIPPVVTDSPVFTGECRLHVPYGTLFIYFTSPFWKQFKYIDETAR